MKQRETLGTGRRRAAAGRRRSGAVRGMRLLLGGLLLGAALAAGGQLRAAPAAGGDPCGDAQAAPALRCAQAPSARFDAAGRLWVAWAQGGHVYVSRSGDRGGRFDTPVMVNATPQKIGAHGENRPKIAFGPQGEIYLSWTELLDKRFTGHIRFARSLDGGRSFGAPLIVNDDRAEISHRFDALVVDGGGNVLVAWLDKRDQARAAERGEEYRGAALYYTWSDDRGRSFKPNRKLLDNSCECCRVDAAVDPDGRPALMWRHVFGDHIRDHALVSFDAPDAPAEPVRVSFDEWRVDACPHHGPALDIDADGVYHMAWFDNAEQRHGVFYARSGDRGRSLSEPLPVGIYEAGAGHADVLAQGGQVYLVWQEFDGKTNHVRLMRSADGGRVWNTVEDVAQSAGDVDYPFLITDGKAVYVAWHTRAEGFRLLAVEKGE